LVAVYPLGNIFTLLGLRFVALRSFLLNKFFKIPLLFQARVSAGRQRDLAAARAIHDHFTYDQIFAVAHDFADAAQIFFARAAEQVDFKYASKFFCEEIFFMIL